MVAALIDVEPQLGDDLLFGAAAVLMVEERFARHLLAAWSELRSSLLPVRTGLTGPVAHRRLGPHGHVRARAV
jgi:hypothetical protein